MGSEMCIRDRNTEDHTVVSEKHSVRSFMYIDDIQLYDNSSLADAESIRDRLTRCVSVVANWYGSRRLQLNADKTETIWFGSRFNLAKLHRIKQSLYVGPSNIQPNSVVRDLGVYQDSELTAKQHIAKTPAACFYNIRRLCQVRRRASSSCTGCQSSTELS